MTLADNDIRDSLGLGPRAEEATVCPAGHKIKLNPSGAIWCPECYPKTAPSQDMVERVAMAICAAEHHEIGFDSAWASWHGEYERQAKAAITAMRGAGTHKSRDNPATENERSMGYGETASAGMRGNPLSELLPCPFCGDSANLIEGDGKFYAACHGPECFTAVGEIYDRDAMPDHEFRNPEEAAKAWNTRADRSPQMWLLSGGDTHEAALQLLQVIRPDVRREAWDDFLNSRGAWGKGGNSAYMHVSPDEVLRIAARFATGREVVGVAQMTDGGHEAFTKQKLDIAPLLGDEVEGGKS